MYKRRKTANPQASSTLKDNRSLLSSFTSSQSSVLSGIEDKNDVPDSHEDIFDASPVKNGSNILLDISNIGLSSQPGTSRTIEPKRTNDEVLQMLLSQESEPLPKIAKITQKKPEERKLALSQEINSIANKRLKNILSKAGLVLGNGVSPNFLTKPQSVFIRNLSKLLDKQANQDEINSFMENLEEYLSDTECLKSALLPTKADPISNILGDSQDSFIRLILSVDCLQSKLISFLLDKICEYTAEDDGGASEDIMALVRMILQSLRYMNNIIEPEKLTQKMFDIIHSVSSTMLKHEITNCLPDIISDAQREETANEFIELMKAEPSLTPSILYTLSNLWLEGDCLYQLQINLIRQLSKSPLDQLPAYVRFLIMGDIMSHADEIINGLRSELTICHAEDSNTQVHNGKSSEVRSTLVLIFEKLRDAVLKSKKLADIWVKNIGKVRTSVQHRPIDLLMLLIIHSTSKSDVTRKRAVEILFKTKIRTGHFKESLICDTLSATSIMIKEHFDDLLKLLSTLLLSTDLTVSSFSAFFFSECFDKLDSMQWRKRIILELISNITVSKGNAKPALNLLHSLTTKYTSKIAPFITLLMLLLDVVMEMKVVEIRQLLDMLCMIAFGDPNDSSIDNFGVQDELCIIVQKQLSCPEPVIFRCGIIGAIVTIRHMIKKGENDANETPATEDEIQLDSMGKKAMNLLDLVLTGTRANAESQVLVFDQLSHMVLNADNLDKIFMKKVSTLMQSHLQNQYIITSSDYVSKDNGLEASMQFCIDNDLEDPIIFNLVDAVMLEAENCKTNVPIVALPGLVRLIRALELADLTEIDALLGCAISLPSPNVYSKFSSVETQVQNLAVDCLFHATNFMREMLNSFVYLIKSGKPEKILHRLRAIVYFQSLIAVCLPQTYNYTPPSCYFDEISGKISTQTEKGKKAPPAAKRKKTASKKKGKESKRDDKEDDENADDASVAIESEDENDVELISLEFSKFKCHLRELEFDVCIVLTQPLTTMPKPIENGICSAELGPNELMLILDDLNSKLRYCLQVKKSFGLVRKQPAGFDIFSTVSLELVVTNVSKLSHHLCNHLHQIVEFLHNLVIIHDGIMDASGMFCPGSHEIKQCLTLILSVFNTYLSWPDLTSEAYSKCLMKTIIKLGGPNINKKDATSLNVAITAALSYLRDITKCVVDLTSAVSLVTLISTIVSLQEPGEKYDPELGDLCEDFLRRKWYDSKGAEARGTLVNQQLCILLDIFFDDGQNGLKNVSKTINWLSLECEGLGNDNSITTFPHFNKNNLNLLIRSTCKGLLTGTKKVLEGKDYKEQLEVWESVTNCLQELICVIKIHDSRVNLRQFLKGSLPILRYFLSQGMNICSTMFKVESALVSQTIKKLQVVTRYIQSICNYSKLNKDSSLIQQLPGIRGTLENILLSVKNMVLQNKCTGAFFMGSMRNKDIHGEIISTEDNNELADSEEITTPSVQEGETAGGETSGNESDRTNTSNKSGSISDDY